MAKKKMKTKIIVLKDNTLMKKQKKYQQDDTSMTVMPTKVKVKSSFLDLKEDFEEEEGADKTSYHKRIQNLKAFSRIKDREEEGLDK